MKYISVASALLFFSVVLNAAELFSWSERKVAAGNEIILNIAPGGYIGASTLKFDLRINGKAVPPLKVPAAVNKDIEGVSEKIYPDGSWVWLFPPGILQGKVEFQGCTVDGVCMLPEVWKAGGNAESSAGKADLKAVPEFEIVRSTSGYMDKKKFTAFLQGAEEGEFFAGKAWWLIILLTVIGGAALNLTPCVLPMVPINLAIIGASQGGRAGLWRGLCYGSGMAVSYGALGIVSALAGSTFGALNSSASFNFVIAALFLFLALGMAGVFNLNFFSNFRIDTGKLDRTRAFGAFVMGAVAALLAGACVAPVVTGVLIFTAGEYQKGNVAALGLPFLLGLGMAIPWPLAGFGLAVLPRPGKFMVPVKYLLALLIAAMGVYYIITAVKLLPGKNISEKGGAVSALPRELAQAEKEQRPLLLFFSASWCKNCHAMENSVLSDPEVKQLIAGEYRFFKINAEDPSAPDTAPLLKKLNIPGFPAFAVIRSSAVK